MIVSWCICVLLIVVQVGFGIAEMFFWSKLGPSLARNRQNGDLDPVNLQRAIRWCGFIAFNQGIYNLFLAGGLIWALGPGFSVNPELAKLFALFLIVAGLAGLYTGIKTVFYAQTIPAIALFGALWLGW